MAGLKQQLNDLKKKMEAPDFWENVDEANKTSRKMKPIEATVAAYEKLESKIADAEVLMELAEEEDDDSLEEEISQSVNESYAEAEQLKLAAMLKGDYDSHSAILSLHAGAGGTEAQDWVSMLYRMYTRWAEKHGYGVKVLDYLDGEEAGIKSVTMQIDGLNAYGYLRSEKGVHRLVRISPFDSSARRHTSFASLDVMPEIEDDGEITIAPDDIKMDVFRASGAGGQHVNKTSSAVRLIHKPTGTVVECQQERSQFQNRDKAMQILRSRLYEEKVREQEDAVTSQRRSQVGTGMRNERIRTYNFPQGRLTDHRIGLTLYKLDAVMNGDLDEIIDGLVTADQAERLKNSQES